MSGRNAIVREQLFTDETMDQDLTSKAIDLQRLDRASIHLIFTGTPTGEFEIQVSGDYELHADGSVKNAGTWTPLTLSQSLSASGSGDDIFIDLTSTGVPWIRVFYDFTSGTGSLNAFLSAKV